MPGDAVLVLLEGCQSLRFSYRDADYVRIPGLLFLIFFTILGFALIENGIDHFFQSLGLSHEEMSLQGKAKKTRKFATVKRMLNPNDIRL